ncbi:hypothetical protein NQ318_003027 [Aromia moschata]|uniref:Uncharacterized protein n=1 Tax=Aromia moschata TaxID=1265417 RepID=A0AAV8YQE8_9CUCU|nr:hypothetical protein NQ318_003027 [Aromia moschata]
MAMESIRYFSTCNARSVTVVSSIVTVAVQCVEHFEIIIGYVNKMFNTTNLYFELQNNYLHHSLLCT